MIAEVRSKVLNAIALNKTNEITRYSNVHSAGVYMLYVDCFQDDFIVPFYIGQTSDFQERHKQHFTQVMALNRLNRECYTYALFSDLYNGHARPCKIFSYMVNHGCTLKDLHMIVLDFIEDKQRRIEIEQQYIDDLRAPFFGFNQIKSTVRLIELRFERGDESDYEQVREKDIEQILRFPMYGYSLYNWYRVCDSLVKVISEKKPNQAIPPSYLQVWQSSNQLKVISSRLTEINHYYRWKAEEDMWAICKGTISDFFDKRKLKSETKKKLVIKVWLFDKEDDRKELARYFSRYADGEDQKLIEKIERIHGEDIQYIRQRLADDQREYCELEEEKERLNGIVFGMLVPKEYQSHPLGAMDESFDIQPAGAENVCYLNVEYSCYKADYDLDLYPQMMRIDYCVVRDGKIWSRTVYLDNSLVGFFDNDNMYYMESGFHRGPFHPCLVGAIDTHISVTMEYRNSINEWVLRDKTTENYTAVLLEINELIDAQTKVVYTTSGYKSAILRFADSKTLSGTLLMKKLRRLCK